MMQVFWILKEINIVKNKVLCNKNIFHKSVYDYICALSVDTDLFCIEIKMQVVLI